MRINVQKIKILFYGAVCIILLLLPLKSTLAQGSANVGQCIKPVNPQAELEQYTGAYNAQANSLTGGTLQACVGVHYVRFCTSPNDQIYPYSKTTTTCSPYGCVTLDIPHKDIDGKDGYKCFPGGTTDISKAYEASQAPAPQRQQPPMEKIEECGWTEFYCQIKAAIFWMLYLVVQGLSTAILMPIAGLFDFLLYYTTATPPSSVGGITDAWKTIKSLSNIGIIFALLFSVIPIVFRIGEANAAKRIFSIILVAILINFSFLITNFIVDVGNLSAFFFYKNISGVAPGQASMSAGYMSAMKFTNILNADIAAGTKSLAPIKIDLSQMFMILLVSLFVFILVTIIFLTLVILLLIRTLYIWFLVILAPVAFLGFAIGKMRQWWNQWWDKLIRWTFFLPAAIFFLLVGLTIYTNVSNSSLNSSVMQQIDTPSRAAPGAAVNVFPTSQFFSIIVGIAFMAGAIVAANASGMNVAKFVAAGAAAAATGGASLAASSVLARTAVRERLGSAGARMMQKGAEKGGVIGRTQAWLGRSMSAVGQYETASERKKGERLRDEVNRDKNAFAGMSKADQNLLIRASVQNKWSDTLTNVHRTKEGKEAIEKRARVMSEPEKDRIAETLPTSVTMNEDVATAHKRHERTIPRGNTKWEEVQKDLDDVVKDAEKELETARKSGRGIAEAETKLSKVQAETQTQASSMMSVVFKDLETFHTALSRAHGKDRTTLEKMMGQYWSSMPVEQKDTFKASYKGDPEFASMLKEVKEAHYYEAPEAGAPPVAPTPAPSPPPPPPAAGGPTTI